MAEPPGDLTLYIREAGRLVEAPAEDVAVARGYQEWPDKGEVVHGLRLTILSAKRTYGIGEEVRVIHAMEAVEAGSEVYPMGPKEVYGEHIDGRLATAPAPDVEDPWVPMFYDGPVLQGPAVDFNYEVTRYTFTELGAHEIRWILGPLRSNVLSIDVAPAGTA